MEQAIVIFPNCKKTKKKKKRPLIKGLNKDGESIASGSLPRFTGVYH